MTAYEIGQMDKAVYKSIGKKPRLFWEVRSRVPGYRDEREVDRSLQRLRKAGKIEHLKKADGGPGWVRMSKALKVT